LSEASKDIPQNGDVVLCCHPTHTRKDGYPTAPLSPVDLRDDLQIVRLLEAVRVQRIDPDTGRPTEFETSFLAICPACCVAQENDPARALAHARGHFVWTISPG